MQLLASTYDFFWGGDFFDCLFLLLFWLGFFNLIFFFFQMVMPGDVVEMTEFQDKTISNSHYVLELMLPNIHLTLPNKSFYEKLYNRQV